MIILTGGKCETKINQNVFVSAQRRRGEMEEIMKKTLSFKSCIIVFYLLVFIAFIIEKRPILSNSTPYFSRIANATNLVPFYYDPNSNYQALQMNIIVKIFLVMPIALYYVIKKDCTLGQLITFILGVSFIFEVAKLLSLRGYFDITDFFYYMAGAALAYYIYRSIKFFTKK